MMLQWHHDLFCQESLYICLINWAEVVTLSGDIEADTLVTPFAKGEVAAPDTYLELSPR